MKLKDLTQEELRNESMKKVKNTGKYTKRALKAQSLLYEEAHWGERALQIKDNGIVDRDQDDIYYNGYDENDVE